MDTSSEFSLSLSAHIVYYKQQLEPYLLLKYIVHTGAKETAGDTYLHCGIMIDSVGTKTGQKFIGLKAFL